MRDRWLGIHEGDAAIGEIEADGHFRIALVGAVADAEPAAGLAVRIEHIEIHALIIVDRRIGRMRVLVLRIETQFETFGRHSGPSLTFF